ncbi:MAG TPA: hypothetical protein VNJ28_02480 [Candidatus Limnocylindrales bacterium]|nr:hypothetical protein [Candidatus Limnocylindrales bacterium]
MNDVFSRLVAAGLAIHTNNADSGREPRRRVNATYEGWPLILSEYSSAAALRKAARWDPDRKRRPNDPPYRFAGLNILVEYGPRTGQGLELPRVRFREAAIRLVRALDPLIGPLEQIALEPVPLPTVSPGASPGSPAP